MARLRAHRIATRVVAATTTVGFVGLLALPAVGTAVPARLASAHSVAWFHDPVSAAGRRAEMAVPADPSTQVALRQTTATFRTESGSLSVPASWAEGHELVSPEALTLTGQALFAFNSPTPTAAARAQLRRLGPVLSHVRALTCEGYTDFGGSASHEQTLSVERASAICALIHIVRPGIRTSIAGYGGNRPVIVGGTTADRAQNRRVILVATASTPLATVPGAPHLSTAVGGDRMATVTFRASKHSGGTKITGYRASMDNGRTWRRVPTEGGFVFTVHGLTNGRTYPVTVEAVNAVGHSVASNRLAVTPSAAAPPAVVTVSSAPVLTAASPGDGSAALAFLAPASDGGAAVTGYEVSTDGGVTWTPVVAAGSGPYTTTIIGLTNGTTYPVTVRAVNSVGDSVASNSLSVTPEAPSVSSAPVLLSAYPGDGSAALTFSAPLSDGGAAIIGYEVSTDGGVTWSAVVYSGSGPYTATITGLTNGTTYPVTVRAVDSVGDSVASNSLDVTPAATVSSAPTLSSATAGDGSAALVFTAPASDGGSAITGYRYSTDGGTTWSALTYSGSGPYTATITGLTNGTTYPVTVEAENGIGDGAASNSLNVTPAAVVSTVPSAPTNLAAVLSEDSSTGPGIIDMTFVTPANGGSPITGYEYSLDGTTWTALTYTAGSPNAATVVDFGYNGCALTEDLYVRALNLNGNSPPTNIPISYPQLSC